MCVCVADAESCSDTESRQFFQYFKDVVWGVDNNHNGPIKHMLTEIGSRVISEMLLVGMHLVELALYLDKVAALKQVI